MPELEALLERVEDKFSFYAFVEALARDRRQSVLEEARSPSNAYAADAQGWENTTVETFLEAALAWAEASDMGAAQGLPDGPSWKVFAIFLYCGKIYE